MKRIAKIARKSNETDIEISVNLDGEGKYDISTGIHFFDHMLSQLSKHSLIDIEIKAKGDIEIDYHHTVEDVGISLGNAIAKALSDKKGIVRYGFSSLPMNEALVNVSVDISGRGFIVFKADIGKGKVGEFDVELAEEFFRSFINSANITAHMEIVRGTNLHHMIEALFKACAVALKAAVKIDDKIKSQTPSTKGIL